MNIATNWKKNTSIFFSTQFISIFGSALVQYAITWYITRTTQSGIYSTIAIICGFVPMFFLSPFAGVWADKYDRKKIIMISDGIIALCTLIVALIFMSGYRPLWLLFVALAARSFGSAVQNPSVSAMLPDIVPKEHLAKVNGINGSLQPIITIISPIISGVLIGYVAIEYIFFIDVITAAIAIFVLLTAFKTPVKAPAEETTTDYFKEMKQGLSYIAKNRYLIILFIYVSVCCLMVAPLAFLTPLQVIRSFGNDIWRLTALEISFSVGMIIGGILLSVWGGFKNRIVSMIYGVVILGASTLYLGITGNFALYIITMAISGISMAFVNIPATIFLQEKVHPDYIGRTFGVLTMINTSVMPLGMLFFGPLADVIKIETLLIVTGVLILLGSITIPLEGTLLNAGKPQPEKVAIK